MTKHLLSPVIYEALNTRKGFSPRSATASPAGKCPVPMPWVRFRRVRSTREPTKGIDCGGRPKVRNNANVDTQRLRAVIFERSGIAIDEHDPIMAVLVASAQQTEEIGARLLCRTSPLRIVAAVAISGIVFAAASSLVTWRVEQRLFAAERAEWMGQQSDPRLAALLHSDQGTAALALAESGVAELLAKCNGRRSWRIENGYCIPTTADGKPDGFKIGGMEVQARAWREYR